MNKFLLAAIACATPLSALQADVVTYTWHTTSLGYGSHVGSPSTASFDVPLADVLSGKILQSDITNINLAYPGMTFNSTTVSTSGCCDFAAFVNPTTGAPIFHDLGQGLTVEAFAGTDINSTNTFLSITFDNVAYSPSGSPLNTVADQFNAINNGNSYSGYPNAGYWTASFPVPAAVPEPATWAMMLLGFGGIGFALRRRRQAGGLAEIA